MHERFLTTYHDLFIHRTDVYARQNRDGGYRRINAPVTPQVLAAHLSGELTAGFYALGVDHTCKWVVLDADQEDGLERLLIQHRRLHSVKVPSYLESSRSGRGHLWVFTEVMSAKVALGVVKALLPEWQGEIFPKQTTLSGYGVGNPMRGPLGIHRRTGEWYPFVSPRNLRPVASSREGNLQWLRNVRKLGLPQAAEILADLASQGLKMGLKTAATITGRPVQPGLTPRETVLAGVGDIYTFVSSFVPLDASGKGPCPFHPPDEHPSFAVSREGDYWHCFHENTGGDAISFYARFKGLNYRAALWELMDRTRGG